PSEYTLAVSMKLTPASKAALICACASATPNVPTTSQRPFPPYVMVPRQISETYKPVRPSTRYRMCTLLSVPGVSIHDVSDRGVSAHGRTPVTRDQRMERVD